jgi:hypothetical protein
MGAGRGIDEFEHLWSGRGRGKADGLPVAVLRRRLGMRAQVRAAVRGVPQVMVKITGGGRGMAAIRESMDYVSKDGEREIETDDGAVLKGGAELRGLKQQWKFGGREIPERSHRREAYNVIMSMPKGTEAALVKAAARAVARAEFDGHQYMMVLHEHQRNPHVHVLVRAEGDDGRRLNPRKADLHRWRERFAAELRSYGVEAAATRQAARGVIMAPRQVWQVHAERAGNWQRPRSEVKSGEAMLHTRTEAMRSWDGIIDALRASPDAEDRKLAEQARSFIEEMPARRLLPAAQPGLPGHEVERERADRELGAER